MKSSILKRSFIPNLFRTLRTVPISSQLPHSSLISVGMDKTKSMTRNQNHHSASTRKREVRAGPWSDLNHHVLYLVMMQLGVVDFVAFTGVCKSWRSFAFSNIDIFMASRPPMSMWVRFSYPGYNKDCYLEDFEGRKFRTLLPHSAGRTCVGLTSGYLILFGRKTRDYWLVNPIKRHELHFPYIPHAHGNAEMPAGAVLVFSPSVSGWMFVTSTRRTKKIWFSTAGQGSWSHVKSPYPILDLHVFKGKIYTLNMLGNFGDLRHVCELSFNREPKLTLLETNNSLNPSLYQEFVSSGENLFVVQRISEHEYNIQELDVDEMKWVSHGKTASGCTILLSDSNSSAAVKPSSWADPLSRRFADSPLSGKVKQVWPNMWYFPHDCFNVNQLDV